MNSGRPSRTRVLIGVAFAIVAVAAGIAIVRAPRSAPRPVLGTLPGFVLEDEQERSTGLPDLHGAVWVAGFISTRCTGPCEMVVQAMAALEKEIASTSSLDQVKLVSFSVEPDVDLPGVLREYGRARGADPRRWTFLTGTRDAVRRVARDGFKLPVEAQDAPGSPLARSQALVLVDRQGRIRGSFDVLTGAGPRDLRAALADVIAEPPPTDVYVPRDAVKPAWMAEREAAQIAAAGSIAAPHDFRFTDRLGESGITFQHGHSIDVGKLYRANHYDHGTAVAVADVDLDGLLDLFFVNQVGRSALFRNLGKGRFEDMSERGGIIVDGRACVGASFGDIDNDGDPDLFVSCVRDGNVLFQNDGQGHFTNITASAGVAGNGTHSSGSVFFDYDGDGLLDLFVTNVGKYTQNTREPDGLWASFLDAFAGHLYPERSEPSLLYHNLGGGRFENASISSGLLHTAWSGDVTAFDSDGDGRPDLYVPSMQGHDEFWYNLGGGRFQNRGRRIFPATPWGSMGVKVLDWNGDGRFDLFVTDMHTDMASELKPEDEKRKHDPKTMFQARFLGTDGNHILGNALFTNKGAAMFVEESDAANAETGWPWGPSAGDLNADGWPDLFVAAGMNYPFRYRGNDVLLNEGGKRFANAEYVLGVEPRPRIVTPWFELDCDGPDAQHDICKGEVEPILADETRTPEQRAKGEPRRGRVTVWAARASRSAAILDLDNDGDLDIVTNNYGDVPQIFISDLTQRGAVHFLKVRLVGTRSNRDGLGAVVTVMAGGHAQVQVNDGKSGYLAQSVMPLYFGLGAATQADSITVKWPSGRMQVVRGPLLSGASIDVREP